MKVLNKIPGQVPNPVYGNKKPLHLSKPLEKPNVSAGNTQKFFRFNST